VPPETLWPTTLRWMTTLPREYYPTAIGDAFPRIANALAVLWERPGVFEDYLSGLLVDTRGGRRGFPVDVLRELHALREHYAATHPDRLALRERLKQPR